MSTINGSGKNSDGTVTWRKTDRRQRTNINVPAGDRDYIGRTGGCERTKPRGRRRRIGGWGFTVPTFPGKRQAVENGSREKERRGRPKRLHTDDGNNAIG